VAFAFTAFFSTQSAPEGLNFESKGAEFVLHISVLRTPFLLAVIGVFYCLALFYALHFYFYTSLIRVARIVLACFVVLGAMLFAVHGFLLKSNATLDYSFFHYVNSYEHPAVAISATVVWAVFEIFMVCFVI